jgi:DNA-3-methyladenine glycosylase II
VTRAILSYLGEVDPVMKQLIAAAGPFAMAEQEEQAPYETLARAIAHQQLNGKAAQSILNRFISTCGQGVFPTPAALLALEDTALRASGFSFSKIAALRDLAAKTLSGVVPERAVLHALPDLEVIERLTAVRGIGRWTVEMLLMFQLRRPDVLPVDDFGVRMGFRLAYGRREMPPPKVLALFGERWGRIAVPPPGTCGGRWIYRGPASCRRRRKS